MTKKACVINVRLRTLTTNYEQCGLTISNSWLNEKN